MDCSTTIAESWKQQTLPNIGNLRCKDLLAFLEESSGVSSYSIRTGDGLNGSFETRVDIRSRIISLAHGCTPNRYMTARMCKPGLFKARLHIWGL